jgi:hypothetical protein
MHYFIFGNKECNAEKDFQCFLKKDRDVSKFPSEAMIVIGTVDASYRKDKEGKVTSTWGYVLEFGVVMFDFDLGKCKVSDSADAELVGCINLIQDVIFIMKTKKWKFPFVALCDNVMAVMAMQCPTLVHCPSSRQKIEILKSDIKESKLNVQYAWTRREKTNRAHEIAKLEAAATVPKDKEEKMSWIKSPPENLQNAITADQSEYTLEYHYRCPKDTELRVLFMVRYVPQLNIDHTYWIADTKEDRNATMMRCIEECGGTPVVVYIRKDNKIRGVRDLFEGRLETEGIHEQYNR